MRDRLRARKEMDQALLAGGDPTALIELREVVKTFKNASGEYTVLKGINAAFYERQFVSIVGRSGSGKSTLLNMMTGIDHPTSGVVRIGDTLLHTMDEGRMSVWRGRQMGIVFQFFQLLPMLTLLENVMLPMDFCETYPTAEREPRALALLDMVGLKGLENKYPAAVSGGQQQSAAVARALANDPPILVADEPTGNLDTKTAERVLEIFEEQVALGKTVLMVTHDNALANRAQRKLVISDGELVNEWLARAFPSLAHGVLLQMNHALQTRSLASGEALYTDGTGPALLLVTAGALEIVTNKPAALPVRFGRSANGAASGRACRLPVGDLFSQADVASLGRSLTGLRAVEPSQILMLDVLPPLAANSSELLEQLDALAQERRLPPSNGDKKRGG